jgi:hypothetical protein
MIENSGFSDREIKQTIQTFLHDYFEKTRQIVSFNLKFIEANELDIPEVNYFILKRFVDTAIKNFENHDIKLKEGLLGKIYDDLSGLQHYFSNFKKLNRHAKVVFTQQFLPSIGLFQDLQDKINSLQRKISANQHIMTVTTNELEILKEPTNVTEEQYLKSVKRKNVDAIHDLGKAKEQLAILTTKYHALERMLEKHFIKMFEPTRDNLINHFMTIINVKTYYMDLLLWKKSSESDKIRTFFSNARIQGDFNIKTFLMYYIRNIDTEKTHDAQWHGYLKQCLSILK